MLTFFRKNDLKQLHSSLCNFQWSPDQRQCNGACSSSSRACISSSGQSLQSLEAPEALSFSRGLVFSPSGATTLPHINHAWWQRQWKRQWLAGPEHIAFVSCISRHWIKDKILTPAGKKERRMKIKRKNLNVLSRLQLGLELKNNSKCGKLVG